MAKQKTYISKRLILRPLGLKDFKIYLEAHKRSLPKQNKWDMDPLPPERLTREIFREGVLRQLDEAKRDVAYIWTLFLKSSEEMVGWLDISTICRNPHQMANLGYFIINRHRGKGYAVEGIRTLIPAAFQDLKFHRLEAVTDLDNKASIAVAKKAGMFREGVKKHYWLQNGRWEDQMVFIATPELFS